MTTLTTIARDALIAWDTAMIPLHEDEVLRERMEALRSALAQPQSEPQHPVAWIYTIPTTDDCRNVINKVCIDFELPETYRGAFNLIPLFDTPPLPSQDSDDARRYRWLKARATPPTLTSIAWGHSMIACQFRDPDRAIDAAIDEENS